MMKRKPRYRNAPYRKRIARIPRPLNVKARSAIQKCTYYNSFYCSPGLDGTGNQQNFALKLQLNSPWLFRDGYDILASSTNHSLLANNSITPVPATGQPVSGTTTCMPGVVDGPATILKYAKGCVVGTKVVLVATPLQNGSDSRIQPGLFYAFKHSQTSSGLQLSHNINKINTLPFRQAKQIMGSSSGSVQTQNTRSTVGQASRIVVNHSPRKFNNIKDIRDNQQFTFSGGTSSLTVPAEGDFLTVGIVPMLNTFPGPSSQQAQAPNFRLDMRIEQTILWTEPLEETTTGEGNYSYPYSAYNPNPTLAQLKSSIGSRGYARFFNRR